MKNFTCVLVSGLSLTVVQCVDAQPGKPEQLVPANFSAVNDSNGNPWDVQSNGTINNGYNDCFDGAMYLQVNGQDFQSSARQMRTSPREYVLTNNVSNVKVTRRILIDTQRGAARYLDVFENIQSAPISLTVQLRTVLGGSCQQVVDSAGQPFAGTLGKKETGFCAIHASYRPCVLFLVADPRSKITPVIGAQSNRTFTMTYSLQLKAKQTVSLMHVIAQRRQLPASGVAGLVKQFYHRKPIDMEIPKPLSRTVANFQLGPVDFFDAGPLLQTVTDVSDYFGVARGEGDFLVLGEDARFKGQVVGSQFLVETQFGRTEVTVDKVAMLIGGNGVGRTMQLHLRNGEVLVGDVGTDSEFFFRGDRGLDVQLHPGALDLLLMRTNKELDGKPDAGVAAMVTMQQGQRLAVRNPSSSELALAAPWGPLNVTLNEIGRLWIEEDPVPTFRLLLSNLSNLPIIPSGDGFVADTERWGKVKLRFVEVDNISNLVLKRSSRDSDEQHSQDELPVPHCLLAGEIVLAATIDLKSIPVQTASGISEVDIHTVNRVARRDDGDADLVVFLNNGDEMIGKLPLSLLPVRMSNHVWQIPWGSFQEVKLKRKVEPPEATPAAQPAAKSGTIDLPVPAPDIAPSVAIPAPTN